MAGGSGSRSGYFLERQTPGTAGHRKGAAQPGPWGDIRAALLEGSSAHVGKWRKARDKETPRLARARKCLALGNFNYHGNSFTPTFRGYERSSSVQEKIKIKSQSNRTIQIHPLLRSFPELNGYFLNLTFALSQLEAQGARKLTFPRMGKNIFAVCIHPFPA